MAEAGLGCILELQIFVSYLNSFCRLAGGAFNSDNSALVSQFWENLGWVLYIQLYFLGLTAWLLPDYTP